ncbi:MAG: ATP-binding protein, partial [Pseudomonadota bacterium]
MAAARHGKQRVIVPYANAPEAKLVEGIEVMGALSLSDVARRHGARVEDLRLDPVPLAREVGASPPAPELAEVIGQRDAVDALITAAAGGHHLLMSGPPGAGKTMLATRLPGIL